MNVRQQATNPIETLSQKGFSIINNVFKDQEIADIIQAIEQADAQRPTFRKTKDIFAIRRFLKEIPEVHDLIFTDKFKALIVDLFGDDLFVVKSIYFDKPAASNWFVAYHQDLTISFAQKVDMAGFGPWTVKQDQFAVQPPLSMLEDNITIRIHLDDTDEGNGALRVVPGSHLKGIYRAETIDWSKETEEYCTVEKGGIMLMKPLLLHASSRSTDDRRRRVVHLEFSKAQLPAPLRWSEYQKL